MNEPTRKPLNLNELSKEQFIEEIEKGLDDIKEGRMFSADEVDAELDKLMQEKPPKKTYGD